MEEIASARQAAQAAERQAIERQYAAQAHALATDPLVRLQVKFILHNMILDTLVLNNCVHI